jgi:hypothetical protein
MDIALLRQEAALSLIDCFAYKDWANRLKRISILAAVEIKHYGLNEKADASNDVDGLVRKLQKNHDNKQIEQGYVVVACYSRKINSNSAKREPCDVNDLAPLNAVAAERNRLESQQIGYIHIYWISDHDNDPNRWIC